MKIEIKSAPQTGFDDSAEAERVRQAVVGLQLQTVPNNGRPWIHFGAINFGTNNFYVVRLEDLLHTLEKKDMSAAKDLGYSVSREIQLVLIEKSLCAEVV